MAKRIHLPDWMTLARGLALAGLLTGLLLLKPIPTARAQADGPNFDTVYGFGGSDATNDVALGDLDGDGDLDLVTGNARLGDNDIWEGHNLVYLNDGVGGFYSSSVDCSDPPDNVQCLGDSDRTTSVALGDLDGDGDLDLVVGNGRYCEDHQCVEYENQVYLNDGAGGFASPITFGGPDNTKSVALGDLDGDGDLDLVVGNWGQNLVYLNDGAGGFASPTPLGGSASSHSVALGDLDGDGDLDLAVGNSGQQNQVYLNDGAGGFPSGTPFGGSDATNDLALGDLDGDGDLDLVVGNGCHHWENDQCVDGENKVYLNDGAGRFALPTPFGGSDDSYSVALGDLDGDGDLDLVVGNDGQNLVYLNDGAGGFASPTPLGGTDWTSSVALGDLDGDGDLDLVVGNWEQSLVYLNSGVGRFASPTPFGDSDGTWSVAPGDLDGDGDLDLLAGSTCFWENDQCVSGENKVYPNDGAGGFTPPIPFGDSDSSHSVALGDLDGDGDLDLVVGNWCHWENGQCVDGENKVYLNDGAGGFASPTLLGGSPFTWSVALGDLDGDGDLDLVVGNSGNCENDPCVGSKNQVYLNDGAGGFASPTPPGGSDNTNTKSVVLGDLDGDGDLDLVVGNYGQPNQVYLNDGAGGFASPIPFGGSDKSYSVALGDLDGDGDLDLVVGNSGQQNQVYLNEGAGGFASPIRFGGSDSTWTVALGDLDGDGDLDLVVGNNRGENLVYLNDGSGGFASPTLFSGSDSTWTVALGDLDGDGDLDLVVGNGSDQSLVYQNSLRWETGLPNNAPSIRVTRPITTGDANFYSTPVILDSPTIPITYTLFDREGDRVRFIRAYYSPTGGGQWFQATSSSGTITTDLSTRLPEHYASGNTFPITISATSNPVSSTLIVPGAPVVDDLDVWLNVSHTRDEDLDVYLTSPQGTLVELFTDVGGSGSDFVGTILDDEAATPITAGTAPFSGRFRPEGSLADFEGETAQGTWTLWVTDDEPDSDDGAITSWGLNLQAGDGTHVFTWQAEADLIKSDNVVFRIEAYQGFTGPGPYQWPYAPAQTFPFRVEAAEWYAKVVNQDGQPVEGAIGYYDGQLLTTDGSTPDQTDRAGLLRLGDPTPGQPLMALAQADEQTTARAAHEGWAYRTYITSLNLDDAGLPQPDTIGEPGQQLVTVREDDPLILFNLVVSIEWDADESYLTAIADAFRQASDYLYDVTDGQMAFGQVRIYDQAQYWADADYQFSTKNTVRPYAFVGGLTSSDEAHAIRVGRFWDGGSGNQGDWDDPDGYRTLIHELGHYALWLYDEYFIRQVDSSGNFIGELPAACTSDSVRENSSDATNASIMFYQYNASELADGEDANGPGDRWTEDCQNTEQQRLNGQADWQTVLDDDHYGGVGWTLNTPTSRGSVMAGPDEFPTHLLPFPEVVVHNGGAAEGTARQLTVLDPQSQAVHNALVALYTLRDSVTIAIDQGLTDGRGKITVYGAASGDTIRAATFDGAYAGAVAVGSETNYQLTLSQVGGGGLSAQSEEVPYLSMTPQSDGDGLYLQVAGLEADSPALDAIVVPGEGGGSPQWAALVYSPIEEAHVGTVSLSGVGLGSGRVRVSGGSLPSSIHSDYNLQWVDASERNDLYSEDGNFQLHLPPDSLLADEAYATVLPTGYVPGPLPGGKQVMGSAYDVRLSGAVTELEKGGVLKLHYHPGVMGVYTDTMIYHWSGAEGEWQEVGGEPSEVDNALSTTVTRPGIYALMGIEIEGTTNIYLPIILKQ